MQQFGRGMAGHPMNQSSYVQQNFRGFQNFLRYSPFVAKNLIPNQDGTIECTFDSEKYSTLFIVSCDDSSVTQNQIDIPDTKEEIEKRDLSLNNPLSQDKFYNEVRNSIKLFKDAKFNVEDITSVEMMIIDSLEKVKKVQDEVANLQGQGAFIQSSNDLNFLLKWNTLDEEEKNKKYSKFCCHEVNLFIYFKDQIYFEQVVRPFLANKMQKDFIDNWLLGNEQICETYKELNKFVQMNALEKCLLLAILVKTDLPSAQ